ncbi:C10 family peptidase [Seonamhaeicola sp. S2-3]|uniref:C10 family peptidase n=1 Tax=Seonamhaeicola sp. S2-3 TaxID=1936081 RepID=UPI0009F9A497|nr:C10 family peptidase [Seonamhaeicola sp. S2-3]
MKNFISKSQNVIIKTLLCCILVSSSLFAQTKAPFMTDVWGGVNCYDNNGNSVYPGNYYTPNHCSAGCVAISMAQILYYYQWPIIGVGSHVFSDNYNGELRRHAVFFDTIEYDWSNMLDEYYGKPSTDIEQRAIGELFYSTATALEMDFEPSGSTSNLNKTPFVYNNFFRYACHYEDVSWPSFWDKLKENVLAGYPVPIAISATRTGDGHVVVANGYKEIDGKPYYYLNWGWYNVNNINGWYNIQGWTSETGGYNTVDGAVFDIMPNPQITSIEATGTGNDFTVNWEVSSRINWNEFTLEQKVDQGNWEEVANGITSKSYTINNPTGEVYQFRVKVMIDGLYYEDSWSEIEAYAVSGGYDGYGNFGGKQYAYARQTPDNDLNFTNDYTFETWIRLKDGNSNGNVIIDQQPVFGLEITDVTATDYSVKFISHSSGAELISSATGNKLENNKWVHIAVCHTTNNTKLFVDGVLRHEDTSTNFNLTSSNSALNIAERYNGGYSGRIIADLDQIRISKTARYTTNFTPIKEQIYLVDENTVLYLPFQDVHNIRLKDKASNLSVIVKNDTDYVEWNFDKTSSTLSNESFELIKTSLSVFPNPVTNNHLEVAFNKELDINAIQFKVFDIHGRLLGVKSNKVGINTWQLDIQNANSGIYVLQIQGDGFTASKKIMIK